MRVAATIAPLALLATSCGGKDDPYAKSLAMGSERIGNRVARLLSVVKHRGSAMSDEIVEYRVDAGGLQLG